MEDYEETFKTLYHNMRLYTAVQNALVWMQQFKIKLKWFYPPIKFNNTKKNVGVFRRGIG